MFAANTKVLIVDDMTTMRKLVKKTLTELGYSIFEEAADGQLAWVKLNEHPDVGVIISDWNMPNCTGLDFLKRVRSDGRFKHLPFILLTAEAEITQVKEAVAAGVDGYVVKPFRAESIKERLVQVHKKRSAA